MSSSFNTRQRQTEWMDDPNADPRELDRALRFIRRVNWLLRYTQATVGHLERFSWNWKKSETIRIVDLGTGSADIPLAILRWARRRKFHVKVVGIDLHQETILSAIDQSQGDPDLTLVRADVKALPFEKNAFDYAIANMFLHHLDDLDVVSVLKSMDRISRRGIIFADLLRSKWAYWGVRASTLFANAMVRHDAAVSVAQSFNREEVLAFRDRAEIGYTDFYRHFGHRFVLAGEKGG